MSRYPPSLPMHNNLDDTESQPPPSPQTPSLHDDSKQPVPAAIPFSIFTAKEKWSIVAMAGIAALFSPLTANIYLPAIPTIASAFHKSVELINLTVTMYMVMQGIAPMVWGPIADRQGRRLIFLACLFILAITCIGLALVPTSDYWLLMLLRCFQAAGSASTVALGSGVIVDIATPAERGGFLGLFTLAPTAGPCIAPIIGGVLADKLGWRSIFWFLTIATTLCFIFMLLFLPETLRSMVGDGSITPPKWNLPLVPIIGRRHLGALSGPRPPKKQVPNPLRLFTHPDVLILLIFNASICAVFYAVTTTISSLFATQYPFLSETDIGLCYLAIGGGMSIGSLTTGRLLDLEYRSLKKRFEREAENEPEKSDDSAVPVKEEDFPIEKARLRLVPVYVALVTACCAGYGWCVQKKVQLAVPLIIQFILGYCVISVLNTTQTLIMDLFPSQGSSITAANNLVRCTFGAALVSVIDLLINALGTGWTFVLLAGICLLVSPMVFWELRMGPVWRERRRRRESNEFTPAS